MVQCDWLATGKFTKEMQDTRIHSMERTNHDPGGSPDNGRDAGGASDHPSSNEASPVPPPPIEPTPPVSPNTLRAVMEGRLARATQAQTQRMALSARMYSSTAMFVAELGTLCAMMLLVSVGLGNNWRQRDYLLGDGVQGVSLVLLCIGQIAALLLSPTRLATAVQLSACCGCIVLQSLVAMAASGALARWGARYALYFPYRLLVSLWAVAGSAHVMAVALIARRNPAASASLIVEPGALLYVSSDGVGPSILPKDLV